VKQEFHLVLAINDFTDSVAAALVAAGLDEKHLTKCGGQPCIVIDDREITDLSAIIRAAVADVQRAGVKVLHVRIPDVEQINAELASASI
jgi:hypothetical protein